MNRKRIVLLLLLGWALMIFLFSSQPYKEQDLSPILQPLLEGKHSLGILDHISFRYDGVEVSVASLGMIHFVEFFVRKAVHFFIFAVLGFLLHAISLFFVANKMRAFWIAYSSVVFYASLDELHQFFTVGRSALWQDVVIDSAGGLIGVCLYYWVQRRKIDGTFL